MFQTIFARRNEIADREQLRQREMMHSERMKALETGQPLPEVELAKANTETVRAKTEAAKSIVATIGRALVPLGMGGIGIGASAVVIINADPTLHWPALAMIWPCVALVGTVAALSGWIERQRVDWRASHRGIHTEDSPDDKFHTAIQE
jgi:hypothetical protein